MNRRKALGQLIVAPFIGLVFLLFLPVAVPIAIGHHVWISRRKRHRGYLTPRQALLIL
jgi:hypothetical protein